MVDQTVDVTSGRGCACVDEDAGYCADLRAGRLHEYDETSGEQCECHCHDSGDDDGNE